MEKSPLLDAIGRYYFETSADFPLYKRLKLAIDKVIGENSVQSGRVLPGERAIAASLSISRVTVRKTMSLLEEEGLLSRRHGAKTEIGSRADKRPGSLTSFSNEIRMRGKNPGCIWLSKQVAQASSAEMLAFGTAGNLKVVRIKRIRTANSDPIAVETAIIPECFLPSADLIDQSLYETLGARGFLPERAVQRVSSQPATRDDAAHLRCKIGDPLLVMERRCFLGNGRIVELCETRYRGDVHDFVFEVGRRYQ